MRSVYIRLSYRMVDTMHPWTDILCLLIEGCLETEPRFCLYTSTTSRKLSEPEFSFFSSFWVEGLQDSGRGIKKGAEEWANTREIPSVYGQTVCQPNFFLRMSITVNSAEEWLASFYGKIGLLLTYFIKVKISLLFL